MIDVMVIGSINLDQVVITKNVPALGETLMGIDYKAVPGGKGANQAIAASRLGAHVSFVGCVGDDANGTFLIDNFVKNNVDISSIIKRKDVPTGIAAIRVCQGQNSIIVVPGANFTADKDLIDQHLNKILQAKIVLLQLEIPYETVKYIVDVCYQHHIPVILNPAPAHKLDMDIINKVTYLTPNEHEAEMIFGSDDYEALVAKYPNKLIITLGDKGAIFNDDYKTVKVEAYQVPVVDTTGAGDTFNGALAVKLISGSSIVDSIKFANKASAFKIQKTGAQTGMPTKKEMEL